MFDIASTHRSSCCTPDSLCAVRISGPYARRGASLVLVCVCSFLLLGFAALGVDVGLLYVARAELQRTADAAALAGASGLATDGALAREDATVSAEVYARAREVAEKNDVLGTPYHLIESELEYGHIADPNDFHSPFVQVSPSQANAIRVTLRRATGTVDGPIPLAFAWVFGRRTANVAATATALLDERMIGFRPPPPETAPPLVIPFTMKQDLYEQQSASGNDQFTFEYDTIKEVEDGIREIRLFPNKIKADGEVDGGGNFGTLNIGIGNEGTAAVENQIRNGITPEQLQAEVGVPEIRFKDEAGNPITYDVTGNTGISSGMKDSLLARVGQIVGFFLHTNVADSGSNAVFTIVDIRFGRLMEVDFTGSVRSGKGLIIQPVAHDGTDIITNPVAPPVPKVGRTTLVR